MRQRHSYPRRLAETVDGWQGYPVIVVGDAMLDEWRFTDPRRLCREAPTPLVTLRRREDAAGGAGNTAVNLAALGARAVLVAPLGDDEAGDRVRACLARAGVVDGATAVVGHRTRVKRRVVAADQILFCEEDGVAWSSAPGLGWGVLRALRRQMPVGDGPGAALVICDYGLGALNDQVREWLIKHRGRFRFVALDAHEPQRWAGLAPTVITPSFAEALPLLSAGQATVADSDRAALALRHGPQLLHSTGAAIAAITLDVAGAVVVSAVGDSYRTRAQPAPASHAVGAGDAYLAAMTLALVTASGCPGDDGGARHRVPVAAELAQLAAGSTLRGTGTCVCSREDLLTAVGRGPEQHQVRVVDPAALTELVRRHREHGACVVFTNGCFDVLHRGHVGYLTEARQLGDVLIVAVNSDASVRRLKGPQRPVNQVEDRVAVLAALSCVDHVVVFEEDSPAALIEAIRPDIYVKGGDYRPELVPEAPLVRRLGGQVHTLGYVPDRSTSAIIERIRSREPIPSGGPPGG